MGTKYWKAKDSALSVFDGKVKEVIADLSNFYYGEKTEIIVDGKHYMKPVYDNKEEGLYVRVNGIRLCYDDFDIPVGNEITSSIKSDYSDEEYWYPEENNKYVVEILDRRYEGNPYYTYLSEERWNSPLKDAIIFDNWEEANKECKELTHSLYSDGLGIDYWPSVVKLDKAHKKIESSRKLIKSDFNPYYEKHPDTPVGYLLGGPADTVTDTDKKAADEYGLFYEGYGTMDGTEKGHLFIGEYQKLKSYFEDYMGHSLADDYIYPYEDSFGQHILDRFEIEMTWVLPTEKDYQDIVNKLNEYVDKEYGREFGTGSIYHFNMYKGRGTNTDGYGHEYPNYVIFDTEGNLDLFSDDEIVQYIDNLLAEKGWYKEPVSGSDNFTIAVNIK